MPLVRAAAPSPQASAPESRQRLLEQLDGDNPDERRRAARALARAPDAEPALGARLKIELDPNVRDALFASLADIGGISATGLIAEFVRTDDAGLRGGAIEALKRLGYAASPAVDTLLADPDPDARILAIEVTRAWPGSLAVPRLMFIIEHDSHVNVCGAAVDVATEVGTNELLVALDALRSRFPDQPFLHFAADIASSRINIRSRQA